MLIRIPYNIHGIDDNIVLPILEDFSSIAITVHVMLNITIHDNIVILPGPSHSDIISTLYVLVFYYNGIIQ